MRRWMGYFRHSPMLVTIVTLVTSLCLLAVTSLPGAAAQQIEVDCPDSSLTSFLLALLDTLYENGLTHFESLLAKASESDLGYDALESWYTDDQITLFVPTDAAFQTALLVPPFDMMSEKAIADTIALHTASGTWGFDALPQSPAKGFADTHLSAKSYLNATGDSKAMIPLVLQQGDQGAISVRLASGNGTTWGWVIQGEGQIWNLVLIPVDTVLPFPPKLSEALTLPTTSRSTQGLLKFQQALGQAGGAEQLEQLTEGGFTIFAPIDDAFTSEVADALASEAAIPILGTHYATNYSLCSRIWVDNGAYEMPVVSGETLLVEQGDAGATITLRNQTTRILRSDIVLENGVMHIIEDVLIDPQIVATASSATVPATSPARTTSPSQSGTTATRESMAGDAVVSLGSNDVTAPRLGLGVIVAVIWALITI